jgi:hypothetical protein
MTDKTEIRSTSSHSAECADIVLRETDRIRLVFRPELVDNPSNLEARVNGTFLYQKKSASDSWEKFDLIPLNTLKKDEGYQLALHSDEVLTLRRELYALARFHRTEGIPEGRVELVKVKPELAGLLSAAEADIDALLTANRSDAIGLVTRVTQWLASNSEVASEILLDKTKLPSLNAIVSLANLKALSQLWADNSSNNSEDFWQDQIATHSFVRGLLFAFPVVVIGQKAYVGGKRLDNRHGNLVDFFARIPASDTAVLVEIKTPAKPLLGAEYRADVLPPSQELIGSIAQVLHYKESLLQDHLVQESARVTCSDPKCLVIIGSSESQLTNELRRRSFERFRERLEGVMVVTFDELFRRVNDLIALFE